MHEITLPPHLHTINVWLIDNGWVLTRDAVGGKMGWYFAGRLMHLDIRVDEKILRNIHGDDEKGKNRRVEVLIQERWVGAEGVNPVFRGNIKALEFSKAIHSLLSWITFPAV